MMDHSDINQKIKNVLAQQIGAEVDDIENEAFLDEDLHMTPADITDFIEKLSEKGFDVSALDLENLETVEDVVEALS